MTLKQLKYFIEIARLRNVTRAAAVLHVSQPSLSRQMQQLENDLGTKLFVRSDVGLALTSAGSLLLQRAPALLEQIRAVQDELSALSATPMGALHLGLPPSLFDLVTLPLVRRYCPRFPEVELCITEGISAHLFDSITAGLLDFAIVSSTESTATLESRLLLTEQLYLVSAPGDDKDGQPIAVGELADVPLAANQPPNVMRLLVDDALGELGKRAQIVVQSSSTRLLSHLAAAGTASTVLAYSAVADLVRQRRVSVRPVAGMTVTWMLVHSRQRALTPGVQALIDMLFELAAEEQYKGHWRGVTVLR
ncbi:MAG: LysR family transcriptional regulator [Chitinophagaceae bacterium]|nr:LysR family transcriptional regulator [Rubrivivax sp.]